jgi:hypothetical protein
MVALVTLGAAVGCGAVRAHPAAPFRPVPAGQVDTVRLCGAVCTDSIELIALGVGGWLVMPWRDTTRLVMTPPAFTNPGLASLALDFFHLKWIRSNRRVVDARLRTMTPWGVTDARLARVGGVLVGHGHYDHLMDVPRLASRLTSARVYGTSTVQNLLFAVRGQLPTDDVEARVGRGGNRLGSNFPMGGVISARPIAWAHAPNVWKGPIRATIAPGNETKPQEKLRGHAHQWKMGEPLAWAIDVTTRAGVVRMFVADAAAPREVILRADTVLAAMPRATRTITLVTPANYTNAAGYPDVLLATLQPDHVVLSHWEDFFERVDADDAICAVPAIEPRRFVDVLQKFVPGAWSTLEPGARLRVLVGQ